MSHTDFRQLFYEKYVSTFKVKDEGISDRQRESNRKWVHAKYLPHLAHLPKDASLLEIACGNGDLLQLLTQAGYTNTQGIDISEEQIILAKSKQLKVVIGDSADFLSAKPNTFDAILAIDLFEHMTKIELVKLMERIHSALKPGGILMMRTPNGQGFMVGQIQFGDITHMTILNPNSFEQLARRTGFEKISFSESGPVAKDLKGIVRVMLWEVIKLGLSVIKRIESGKTQSIWTENMIAICQK